MRAIEIVFVLLVLVVAGFAVYQLVRWYVRPVRAKGSVALPSAGPWQVRYTVGDTDTVWWVYRTVGIAGHKQLEEAQEIARIDSTAEDFDEKFLRGERHAHDRAMLLNSTLSP